jgi:cell division protein FtsX
MPATFRNVAYLLLIVLMIGVATGWLGAIDG